MTKKIAVLVVGMHRSGTSALARTIALLGARLPSDLVGPNDGNPHGHWEPQQIVDLNDKMLSDAGSDVYSILDFNQDWFKSPRAQEFAARAVEILKASFDGDPFIVIKDPRVALLLPIWHRALAELNYRCVHVLPVRHPNVVADSLRRRHLKTIPYDAWQDPRGQAVWLRYTIAAVINTRGLSRCFVNYSSLINDWRDTTRQIASKLDIVWPRTGYVAEREIDTFLHQNELADARRASEPPDPDRVGNLSLKALAEGLHSAFAELGDETDITDKIAQTYQNRMAIIADLIAAYENLYPTIWRYYESYSLSEQRNAIATERIAGMSNAVQNLWQDLAKASSDASVVQQDLGSHVARVVSLEAALDHHGKMLAESNAHRDRYFADLGLANHREGLVKQELAQTEALVAAIRKDKAEALNAVRADRDQRIAEVIAEKDRISTEIIFQKEEIAAAHLAAVIADVIAEKDRISTEIISQKDNITAELIEIVDAMRRSTSWRLTSPIRKIVRWIKRR